MSSKTEKIKKSSNNKTIKKKAIRKQFKVDGKSFRLKDDSSWTRINKQTQVKSLNLNLNYGLMMQTNYGMN